jgi:hypothetical protein
MLAAGLCYLYITSGLPRRGAVDATFIPYVLATVMILLGLLQAVSGWRRQDTETEEEAGCGDAVTAIPLGGLMIHGIQPGPMLFLTQGEFVYTIFAALILAAVMMLVLEFWGLRIFVRLLAIPKHILLPVIVVLCAVGAFGLASRIFDIWTILGFGVLGYAFVKAGIPTAPFIIGFILGPMAETNFRRDLQLAAGDATSFLTNPISGTFLGLAAASVCWQIYRGLRPSKIIAAQTSGGVSCDSRAHFQRRPVFPSGCNTP